MIPTAPIGSIPRPLALVRAVARGGGDEPALAPFSNDESTSREPAFAKIGARMAGTRLAAERLGTGRA